MEAAFIRGTSPADWFEELENWGLSEKDMTAYIVPESIRSVVPGGLFVVFSSGKYPALEKVRHPYGGIKGSFYIPVEAELYPEFEPQELQGYTLWDCRVYHPSVGLVGFERKDQVDWASLLSVSEENGICWEFAHKGMPAHAPLTHVGIVQKSAEDIIETLKEDVGTKSLHDIPKDEHNATSFVSRTIDRLKKVLFSVAHTITAKTIKFITENSEPANSEKGVLNHLEEWLNSQIKDLEQKRDSELKRLLTLFEKDLEEALKYAIPLDTPFLNRGKSATSSFKLSRRDTTFSLGGLGGGGSVDLWDVNRHYHELRTQYQAAATKEIEAGRYKKAAYIYANLIGDFSASANVLEQGKHYHEAAALYVKYLKAPSRAAQCYEKGGMYSNAIELYTEVKQYEAAADLYIRLEQTEQAHALYKEVIHHSLQAQNNIEAARVASEKLKDSLLAQEILLEGWNNSKQQETCLLQYFSEVNKEDPATLINQIQKIYRHHTPNNHKRNFLNVLEAVRRQYPTVEIENVSTELAYEIISTMALSGDTTKLHTLKKFIDGDPMISKDTLRYIHQKKNTPAPKKTPSSIQFGKNIDYVEVVAHRQNILVLGYQNTRPILIRADWEGNFEVYKCNKEIEVHERHFLIQNGAYSNFLFLYSDSYASFPDMVLPQTNGWQEALTVRCTDWLSRHLAGACINAGGGVSAITIVNSGIKMYHYTIDGKLLKTQDYTIQKNTEVLQNKGYRNLYHKKGAYYTYDTSCILKLLVDGTVSTLFIQSTIQMIALSPSDSFLMAAATDEGLVLIRQNLWELKVTTSFFASDLRPFLIRFVSTDYLVVAEKNTIVVFDVHQKEPYVVEVINSLCAVVDIISAHVRNSIAVLDEEGRLTSYKW